MTVLLWFGVLFAAVVALGVLALAVFLLIGAVTPKDDE